MHIYTVFYFYITTLKKFFGIFSLVFKSKNDIICILKGQKHFFPKKKVRGRKRNKNKETEINYRD